jgi:uncharacterized membrane protein YkvA (DUF1232 family)
MDRALVSWARDRFEADVAAAQSVRALQDAPEPRVIFTAVPRRFSIGWVRVWIALAGKWTRDDWRWWYEIKAMALGNRLWQRWRSIRGERSIKEEVSILATVLADWRTGFSAKVSLIVGVALPFMPFDVIPNRIPLLGHLDDASYVLGGLFLARLLVPEEALPERPARNTAATDRCSRAQASQSGTGRFLERRNSGLNSLD